jgi:hypothetical protein
VTVSGAGAGQLRVFVINTSTGEQTDRVVAVPPGTTQIDLPVSVPGDTRFGPDVQYRVLAKAGQRTVVGDYVGSLTVVNDDPAPASSPAPVAPVGSQKR